MHRLILQLGSVLAICLTCNAKTPWPSVPKNIDLQKVNGVFGMVYSQAVGLKMDELHLEGGDTSFPFIDTLDLSDWNLEDKKYLTFLLLTSLTLKDSEIVGIAVMLRGDAGTVAEALLTVDRRALLHLFGESGDASFARARRAKFLSYARRLATLKDIRKYPVPK